jgi:hypothetical protein
MSLERVESLNGNAIALEEATMMTLKTLFEKEVFIRVSEDQSTLICTTKWRFFSLTRRFGVDRAGSGKRARAGRTPQAAESDARFREASVLSEPEKRGLTLL